MDEETLKRIVSFITDNGQTIETLPKSRLDQLEKADTAIQKRLTQISAAKETLKNCGINVSVIAADSGISRKTFYNNDLLRLYVEKNSCDPEESASVTELQRLKVKNEQFKEQIDAFLIRDIETENLRHENRKLTNEISTLQTRNKNLEEQYATAVMELQKLCSKLAEQNRNVIPFSPSDK